MSLGTRLASFLASPWALWQPTNPVPGIHDRQHITASLMSPFQTCSRHFILFSFSKFWVAAVLTLSTIHQLHSASPSSCLQFMFCLGWKYKPTILVPLLGTLQLKQEKECWMYVKFKVTGLNFLEILAHNNYAQTSIISFILLSIFRMSLLPFSLLSQIYSSLKFQVKYNITWNLPQISLLLQNVLGVSVLYFINIMCVFLLWDAR